MRVKVEGLHALEPAAGVEVAVLEQRLELSRAGHRRRAQPVLIVNRHAQSLHHRARVLAETLLARNQRVAVVRVFHGALREIARHADVVVRAEDQARALALEPLAQRFDFFAGRRLLGDQMIEPEHHQRVRVVEDAGVERQLLAGLVNALVDGDWMTR